MKAIFEFFRDIWHEVNSMAITAIRLILLGFFLTVVALGLGHLFSRFFTISAITAAFLVAGITIGAGILDRLTSIAVKRSTGLHRKNMGLFPVVLISRPLTRENHRPLSELQIKAWHSINFLVLTKTAPIKYHPTRF